MLRFAPRALWAVGVLGCMGPEVGVATAYIRPTDPTASGARFDPTDVVETYGSPGGGFLLHYTRAGRNAVPIADVDTTGVPDFVESVGATYDEALAFYQAEGFRDPLGDAGFSGGDGGDGRFDVYLVDFAGIGDGAFRRDGCLGSAPSRCFGHMVQDEEFEGYPAARRAEAIRILASHELFHAVQAAYDADLPAVFSEGTAVWATEAFDPATSDLEDFSGAYITMTGRSLDVGTTPPADSFTYGSGVVFLFLAERFGDDVIRTLFEALENGAGGVADPAWVATLDAILARDHASSWRAALEELAQWILYTDDRADPALSFMRGDGIARFSPPEIGLPYMDDHQRILPSSIEAFFTLPLGRNSITARIVPTPGSDDAEALTVIVARLGTGTVREVERALDPTVGASVSMEPGDSAIVMIVRGNDVATHTPGICIGSPIEVQACVEALSAGTTDAGVSDAGVPSDAGLADAGVAPPPPATCACRARGDRTPPFLGVVVLGALVLSQRRRVRAHRARA